MSDYYLIDDIIIHAKHKYIARVATGNKDNPWRYFYTQQEYDAYLAEQQKHPLSSYVKDVANNLKNGVHSMQEMHDALSSKDEKKKFDDEYAKLFPDSDPNESTDVKRYKIRVRRDALESQGPKDAEYTYNPKTRSYERQSGMTQSEYNAEKKKLDDLDKYYLDYENSKKIGTKLSEFWSARKKYQYKRNDNPNIHGH